MRPTLTMLAILTVLAALVWYGLAASMAIGAVLCPGGPQIQDRRVMRADCQPDCAGLAGNAATLCAQLGPMPCPDATPRRECYQMSDYKECGGVETGVVPCPTATPVGLLDRVRRRLGGGS